MDDVDDDINNSTNLANSNSELKKRGGPNQRLSKRPRKRLGQIMKEAAVQKKYIMGK